MPDPAGGLPEGNDPEMTARLDSIGEGRLPWHLGIQITAAQVGRIDSRLEISEHHLAPNGFLHAATVIALADTSCGYGSRSSLPEGASGFTTIELKSNFISTLTSGALACTARIVHAGRTTQLWDAEVTDEATGKVLALFRCTQAVLWPRPS